MSEFRSYTCWDPETVRRTIFSDVGAIDLEEDALFLSTHVSLPVEQRKPSYGIVDEHAVLQRILDSIEGGDSKNLVIAVTGPSGSGKSHLVRWLRAHVDQSDPRLEVVYVPRRVTSLREITQLLLAQLGGSLAKELEDQVERAVASIEPVALTETLLNRLWESLKFRPPPGQVQFAEQLLPPLDESNESVGRGGLAYLLGQDKVRDHLLRPEGILAELARSVLGNRTGGDTEKPSFTAPELDFNRLSGIRAGLPRNASTALNILGRETGRVAAATLLNAVRDTAIQEVLGMRHGRGLREVFADTRKRLRGRQLVLMFEDLALIDFVEGAVLDEFANHGDAQHAPLRVVFAVTDDKYATLEETIEGRVTHRFWIGEVPLHNAVTPTEVARRDEFFGLYLNAARVGRDALVAAHKVGDPVPNKCSDCIFRVNCHNTFGKVDTKRGPIGLYPYNNNALIHGIAKQFSDRHRINRLLTPRTVIEELIDFVLVQAHQDLMTDSMPSERLTEVLRDGSALVSPRDLVPEFGEGTEELARVFGVRSYWFERSQETDPVAIAFSLPTAGKPRRPEPRQAPPPRPHASPQEPRVLPDAVEAIIAWEQGEELDPRVSTDLRRLLRELTEQRVALDRYLLHPASPIVKDLLKAALGDASFDIEGAPGSSPGKQLSLPISRSNSGSRTLIAALWFRDHGHWLFNGRGRKWDLPGTREPELLGVELETFLADCASKVEASVVSTLFVGGEDPVQVAVNLSALATQAAGESVDGAPPQAWRPVANAAQKVLESSVSDDIVSALAAARQSPAARPAVIDSVRTALSDVDRHPRLREDFRQHYSALAQQWDMLRQAVDDAIEPTMQELLQGVDEFRNLLGEDNLADVGEAAIRAGHMANNEQAFARGVSWVDFENAAQRVRQASVDLTRWHAFEETARSSGPTLRLVLEAIPHAGTLRQVVDDLRLIEASLSATREVLDKRLAEETGGRSLDEERRRLIKARDELVAAATAAREVADH